VCLDLHGVPGEADGAVDHAHGPGDVGRLGEVLAGRGQRRHQARQRGQITRIEQEASLFRGESTGKDVADRDEYVVVGHLTPAGHQSEQIGRLLVPVSRALIPDGEAAAAHVECEITERGGDVAGLARHVHPPDRHRGFGPRAFSRTHRIIVPRRCP
jgi:hypothetical protein